MINIKNFSHLNNETSNLNDNFFSIKKKNKIKKKNSYNLRWLKKWKPFSYQYFRWASTIAFFAR